MPQPTPQESLAHGVMLDGRYRIEKLIGSGGYASVYKALDTTHKVERAIKEVTDPDKGVQEQFKLEADLLITHNHPNIPKGYYVFQANRRIYFVMDFVGGKDLEELLNESLTQHRRPLDEGHVLRWAIAICGALTHLHTLSMPIIHRDIKPANIKITPDDRPVLIDFGLAKLQQGQAGASATRVAAQGVSPGFAPPEQYMAKGRTDARTDIYGLGATLYACLTGRDPAEAPARLLAQTGVTHGSTLDEPRKLNPRITRPTEAVILKALELSPSKRQQSAIELEHDLRDALDQFIAATSAGSTVSMPPVATPPLDQASGKRHAVAPPQAPQAPRPGVLAMLTPGKQQAGQQAGQRAPLRAAPAAAPAPSVAPAAPAALADPRTAKHAVAQATPLAAAGAAGGIAAGAALARQAPPPPAVSPDTGLRRTLQAALPGSAGRSSGKHPIVPPPPAIPPAASAQAAASAQPLVATAAEKHPVLQFKGATAATPAVAGAAGVALAEKEKSGKQKRISAKQPAVMPTTIAPAAPRVDPRSWIHTGTVSISGFGKWMLAASAIETLWGAAALTTGIISVVNHGIPTALLLKLALGWLVIVAALSLYGGQALNRPVYRRGRLGSVRRAMQGTGLFFFSVVVHLVALWGATIFIGSPGNQTLAVIAYTVFGVNVLVAGALSVYNILD